MCVPAEVQLFNFFYHMEGEPVVETSFTLILVLLA